MKFPNPKNIGNPLPSKETWNRWGGNISSGTGSTVRWLDEHTPSREHWRNGRDRAGRFMAGVAIDTLRTVGINTYRVLAIGSLGLIPLARRVGRGFAEGMANERAAKSAGLLERASRARDAALAAEAKGNARAAKVRSQEADRYMRQARGTTRTEIGVVAISLLTGNHPGNALDQIHSGPVRPTRLTQAEFQAVRDRQIAAAGYHAADQYDPYNAYGTPGVGGHGHTAAPAEVGSYTRDFDDDSLDDPGAI